MRGVLAWLLYGLGHSIWWCFDRSWCGGMHWPIYQTYNALMNWSSDVQGSGERGPWSPFSDYRGADAD